MCQQGGRLVCSERTSSVGPALESSSANPTGAPSQLSSPLRAHSPCSTSSGFFLARGTPSACSPTRCHGNPGSAGSRGDICCLSPPRWRRGKPLPVPPGAGSTLHASPREPRGLRSQVCARGELVLPREFTSGFNKAASSFFPQDAVGPLASGTPPSLHVGQPRCVHLRSIPRRHHGASNTSSLILASRLGSPRHNCTACKQQCSAPSLVLSNSQKGLFLPSPPLQMCSDLKPGGAAGLKEPGVQPAGPLGTASTNAAGIWGQGNTRSLAKCAFRWELGQELPRGTWCWRGQRQAACARP